MLSQQILNKWHNRYLYINITADELLHFSQDDFDKKLKYFADQGLTDMLLSGPTHWRWSFRPWWDQINQGLGRATNACHKYGLRAVEHHSSTLTYSCQDDGSWPNIDYQLRDSYKAFPGLREFIITDTDSVDGIPVSSFRQVDGRTGKWYVCGYHDYAFCCNNPDFRRFYFKYLEDIYSLGIDGIMTDDVEIYSKNACACPHCRRLFKDETGYNLPDPEHWSEIADDFNNPIYVAFQRFRHETNRRFQVDVKAHYESLGLTLTRPNYVASCLGSNGSAYPFEAAGDQWTVIMHESIWGLKTGHLLSALEAIHRDAMAKRYGQVTTTLFYPRTDTERYFSFALAWCWGQLYTGSGDEIDIRASEIYRKYEAKHWRSLFGCQKQSDLAFYFSPDTRDFTATAYDNYQKPFLAWLQGSYVSGLGTDMVFEKDSLAELCLHRTIVASHIAMLSDERLALLGEYVSGGGRLVIIGPFGIFRADGSPRTDALSAFDFQPTVKALENIIPQELLFTGSGKSISGAIVEKYISNADGAKIFLEDSSGGIVAVRKSFGKGEVIYMPSSIIGQAFQAGIVFPMLPVETPGVLPHTDAPLYMAAYLKDTAGAFLANIVTEKKVILDTANPDLLGFTYLSADDTIQVVHILNIANTLEKEQRKITDYEDIAAFEIRDDNRLPHPVHVTVSLCNGKIPSEAIITTPERAESLSLPVNRTVDRVSFTIPSGYFSGYAMAELVTS